LARDEKVLVPLPRQRSAIATHVRSTLLLSSVQSLRSQGLFERFSSHIEPKLRDVIVMSAAGVWLPMDVGLAHYRACDALGLTLGDQVQMGHQVGQRVQGNVLGLLIKTAKGAGVTPWMVLGQVARLWDRVFHGGAGPCVKEFGPKEAHVELVGLPLLGVAYFRNAYRGTFQAGLELFCTKAYVSEIGTRSDTSTTFRVSWA
jgi:hypothetical protein